MSLGFRLEGPPMLFMGAAGWLCIIVHLWLAGPMPDTALLRQLEGFSLTTAEILYHLPDYPRLLQSYIWQDYNLAPRFPKLIDFLNFWATNLDGRSIGCASPIAADRASRVPIRSGRLRQN
jgi:uncharacterized protein Usg